MSDETNDVKEDDSASSAEFTATSTTDEVVKEASTTTEKQPSAADLAKGFEDAVKAGFDKATSQEQKSTSEEKTEEVESKDKKDEAKEEAKKDEEKEKGPIPYARFVEVNTAKQQLEQQLNEQKDFVAAQKSIGDFCINNNINNEEFSFWLSVAAKVKNDPEGALKMLAPHVQQLQSFKGEILSPELQKAVDDGEMSLAWAKKLAASENKTKFSEQQSKLTQEQIHQHETQRFMNEVQTSVHAWAKAKMEADPDFKPKANESDDDGKFEFVQNKMAALYQTANLKSAADMIAFAEKVYSSVNKSFAKFKPHLNGTRTVKSNTTVATTKGGDPKSFEEAMALGVRKAGVNFNPLRK